MNLQMAAEAVRDAKVALEDTKDRARAALGSLRLPGGAARYWELEQQVDRLEERLIDALADYFTISERARAGRYAA